MVPIYPKIGKNLFLLMQIYLSKSEIVFGEEARSNTKIVFDLPIC